MYVRLRLFLFVISDFRIVIFNRVSAGTDYPHFLPNHRTPFSRSLHHTTTRYEIRVFTIQSPCSSRTTWTELYSSYIILVDIYTLKAMKTSREKNLSKSLSRSDWLETGRWASWCAKNSDKVWKVGTGGFFFVVVFPMFSCHRCTSVET